MARAAPPNEQAQVAPPRRPEFPKHPDDLERLAAGDREAFDSFFECWLPRVLGWAQKRLSSNADARAVAESTLERAISQLDERPESIAFDRWLLAIASYEVDVRRP